MVLLKGKMKSEAMKYKYQDVGNFLSQFFNNKRKRNSKYSLRAFARDIGISAGRASEFLSGRSLPGKQLRDRIAEAMKLDKKQRNQLNFLVENHVSIRKKKSRSESFHLTEKEFTLLPDWKHFAVLNLLNTSNCKPDASWMAERLALTPAMVEDSLKKLCLAGLVAEENGFYKATHQHITSTTVIPSEALRNYNRQMIEKSLWSLENVPLELRNITSIMMTANPNNLYKLKVLTNEFKQRAAELFGEGEATEVYNICIQIVPSTVVEQKWRSE